MSDNEIIKALECCTNEDVHCIECPYDCTRTIRKCCYDVLSADALSLINRQKAEIERLQGEIDKQYEIAEANVRAEIASGGTSCHWCEDQVRAEAIKQFADKTKDKFDKHGVDYTAYAIVDDVAKEVVGEDNNSLLVDKQN